MTAAAAAAAAAAAFITAAVLLLLCCLFIINRTCFKLATADFLRVQRTNADHKPTETANNNTAPSALNNTERAQRYAVAQEG